MSPEPGIEPGIRHGADAGKAATAARRDARVALIVSCLATLLVLFVFTLPLTTLIPTLSDLDGGAASQAWILSAMSIGAAAGLLSTGAFGDRYGRRRVVIGGLIAMAIATGISAFAWNTVALIVSRVMAGLGGAAILSCGLGLIAHHYPAPRDRSYVTGLWAASLGAGVALGPIGASLLEAAGGWRMPYLVTALAVACVAAAGRIITPDPPAVRKQPFDALGTTVLGLGMVALLGGLTELRTGVGVIAVTLLASGLALLAAFILAESRVRSPMLDLALFRRRGFVGASFAAFASGAGVLSLMSLVPVLLQQGFGIRAGLGGIFLLAWSATTSVGALSARSFPAAFTPSRQLLVGFAGCAAAQASLIHLSPGSSLSRIVAGLFIAGVSNGLLNAALGHQAVATVPPERAAMGSGANNTARYLGSAIGLTAVALVLGHVSSVAAPKEFLAAWDIATLVTVGASLAGMVAVLFASRVENLRS